LVRKIQLMNHDSPDFGVSYSTIFEVTLQTLRHDDELRLCEALRLIEATRKAVERNHPQALESFDREVLPQLRQALNLRFNLPEERPLQ